MPKPIPSSTLPFPLSHCLKSALPLGLGLWICGASASPAPAQTLMDAWVNAYLDNPALQAARAELRQTDEQAPQARGGWRPTVTLTGSAGRTEVEQKVTGITTLDAGSSPTSVSLSVSQPLYTFGRVSARVEAADATIEAQRAQLFTTEQSVLLSTATSYLTVVRELALLELQRDNLRRLELQLEATRARFEVEDLTRTDVAQAEARVAEARADVTRAEAALERARVSFERIAGLRADNPVLPELPGTLPATKAEAVEAAETRNFSLIQARHAERAARRQLEAARADLLPSLDLVAEVNRARDSGGQNTELVQASATVRFTVPLYQGGVVYSKVRQARENLNRLRFLAVDRGRNAGEEAANAFETYASNLAQFESLQAQIDAAETALEGVRQESSVGARTVLDVLDAERALLNARIRRISARHEAMVSGYQLLAATGGLTAQDLGLPVAYYDFDANYTDVRARFFGTR